MVQVVELLPSKCKARWQVQTPVPQMIIIQEAFSYLHSKQTYEPDMVVHA
jgi:hypothetical protein